MQPQDVEDIYPLSPLQQGLLFHALAAEEAGVYVQELDCRLRGDLDASALAAAWQRILERHPVLRTAFVWEGTPEPLQVVGRRLQLPSERHDLGGCAPAEQERRIDSYLQANRERGFDLSKAPLARVALFRLGADLHRMVFSHHHIVLDGWSLPILLREVFSQYEAARGGRNAALPRRRPYRDYVAWLKGRKRDGEEAFWRQTLRGWQAPLLLAADGWAPRVAGRGERLLRLSRSETERLQAAARQHQVTLNTVMQGAWAALLGRYCSREDVLFGAVLSSRPAELAGSEAMVGLFLNTLPVRVAIDPAAPGAAWLRSIQSRQAEMRQYDATPLHQVLAWSDTPRGLPLFENLLDFASYPLDDAAAGNEAGEAAATLRVEGFRFTERTNYPLAVIAAPGSELPLRALYDGRRFAPATIERMLGHLRSLLVDWCADPGRPVGAWRLLSAAERLQLLAEWNDTAREAALAPSIQVLFEQQALRVPEAPAVHDGSRVLTYRELNSRANRLARHLAALGAGPGEMVGVYLDRGWEMVPVLLAILKAGAAYVPLGAGYPAARVHRILSSLGIRLLVAGASRLATLAAMPRLPRLAHVIVPSGGAAAPPSRELRLWTETAWQEQGDDDMAPRCGPGDLAYVIFTSGSTGDPKGVMVRHRPVVQLIDWVNRTFAVGASDRILFITSLCFDLSVYDVFGLLAAGGSIRVAGEEEVREPMVLARLLAEEPITFWDSAPAALQQLVPHLAAGPQASGAPLRLVFLSGDWVPVRLPDQVRAAFPRARVIALGGATEATVWSNFFPVAEVPGDWPSIPYGRPICNARYHVLDRYEPCPIGIAGDLYIGGACLAAGYAGEPALTAAKFVPNPFAGETGEVLYRTGDRARYLEDGNLEFLGRLDNQIKIRGFRVEMGEVEVALRQHPGLAAAVVLAREDEPGRKRLVAYVVPAAAAAPAVSELRRFLGDLLPAYMVPAAFVFLAALPLTANGKVDRGALLPPEAGASPAAASYLAPRSAAEELLTRIWARVLRCGRVGVSDNFFELGGDSILSLQVVAEAGRQGLRITSRQVFEHQTIGELAAAARWGGAEPEATGEPAGERVPLTPVQHWFFEQELPDPHHFYQAVLLLVRRPLDPVLLAAALYQLTLHHDALRLRFRRAGGTWLQIREGAGKQRPVAVCDLSRLVAWRTPEALSAAAGGVQASLDLAVGSTVRMALFVLGPGQPQRLLLVAHHLVVDAVSWRILLEDLQTAYEQLAAGAAVALPGKTASFRQWSERLAACVRSGGLEGERELWLRDEESHGAGLPRDFPAAADGGEARNTVGSMAAVSLALEAGDTRSLVADVPRASHTRVHDLLVAALALAVSRWSGGSVVQLDLEGHGREALGTELDLSRSVGWFTAIFPLVLDLGRAPLPGEALALVEEQLRALPRGGAGYGLLRYLGGAPAVERRLRSLPRSEIAFNYLGQIDRALPEDSPFSPAPELAGPARSPRQPRRYLLEIDGGITSGELRMIWKYGREVHRRETIERLASDVLAALRELIRYCRSARSRTCRPADFPLARIDRATLDRLVAEQGAIEDLYPLSPLQQGLLVDLLLAPGSCPYVAQLSYRIAGPIDSALLAGAAQRVIERHGILRTAFVWDRLDEPLQVVHPRVTLHCRVEDWRGQPAGEQERRMAALLAADRKEGFDLSRPPLLRLVVLWLGERTHEVLWTFHHLLLDGWSLPLVLAEVAACYAALAAGREPELDRPIPFRHYVEWLRDQDPTAAEAYWRGILAGFREPVRLPPHRVSGDGARGEVWSRLAAAETAGLEAFARRHHLTLNTLAQGAMAVLVGHLSGRADVVFGTIVSGRPADLPQHAAMIGMFINNLPVRARLRPEEGLVPWLQQLQLQQSEMRRFEHTPLASVQRWSGVPRQLPLFECTLACNNYPIDAVLDRSGSLEVTRVQVVEHTTFPFEVTVMPGQRLSLRFTYDASRFEPAAIARMSGHYVALLRQIAAGGAATVGALAAGLEARDQRERLGERERRRQADRARFKSTKTEVVGLSAAPMPGLEE